MSDRLVLGIESAIAGGSICLSNNGGEIESWIGDGSVSRAEDLVPNVDRILTAHSINLKEIDRIVVSIGPGSFTGIKVGISTVMGLRAAVGMTCVGISSLDALSLTVVDKDVTVVLPVGRGTICIRSYSNNAAISEPRLIDESELLRISSESDSALIIHGSLFDRERFPTAIDGGWNMASYLCASADSKFASDQLRPLFVERKSSNI